MSVTMRMLNWQSETSSLVVGSDLPLCLDFVCRIADQLHQNSPSKGLLFYKVILMHSEHCLDVVLRVAEDDSVAFLAPGLSSNRLDLDTLHHRFLNTSRPVFEDIGERACIYPRKRGSWIGSHD